MSMDKSLKTKGGLSRHRNVLTRAERILTLQETNRWGDDATALGLPKVSHRKVSVGKKTKKKDEAAEGETTEEASPAT
ncbi:MAG: small basic protein [Planctomycetota bacterium]|jgi:small basic protein (TIGR04137 family)